MPEINKELTWSEIKHNDTYAFRVNRVGSEEQSGQERGFRSLDKPLAFTVVSQATN